MNKMKSENLETSIIIYEGESGVPRFQVRMQGETVWLTQAQLVVLFQSSKANISEHIKNIYNENELTPDATVRKFRIVQKEGNREVSREVDHYNLDLIISLGYRVKSSIATKFRIWATARLSEYVTKGFTIDDERLKDLGGGGYWKELLARIRDIRASEKVFYRQVLDIYATSIDYDPNAKTSIEFFKKVQNKIHFAIHGHTAAEVIFNRADAEKEFMGLTTFTGSKPQSKDVTVAKNYLSEKELRALGQIVSGYLDFAERQAEKKIHMKMEDWVKHLDGILSATGEKLLLDAGKISHKQANEKAKIEYKKYQQKTLSEVEKAFLNSINETEKKIIKNTDEK